MNRINLDYLPKNLVLNAFLLVLLFTSFSCEGTESSNNNEKIVSDEPYEFEWTTADDIDFVEGEKIIVEGYIQRVVERKNGDLVLDFGPRRNSSYEAGIFDILLPKGHPLLKGYDQVKTYQKVSYNDSTEVVNYQIYLENGDTLKTKLLGRTKLCAQLECQTKTTFSGDMIEYTFSTDTIYAIPSNLEDDFEEAVPLTPELGKYSKEKELTYCYIDGQFTVPYSLPKYADGHSMPFDEEDGFYKIRDIHLETGSIQPGGMKRLYDGFTKYSIKIYDTQLEEVGCDEKVRVFGVHDKQRHFSVEEIERLDSLQ